MKKLLSLILLSSFVFCASVTTTFENNTDPSVFRTNTLDGTVPGSYVNTTVPRIGYLTMVAESKPTDNILVTGNLVIYAVLDTGAVVLSWVAKDVSGNITSGNVTGF